MYCKPNSESSEDDIFPELNAAKLWMVQTAHTSVRTVTLTVQDVSKFKGKRIGRKRSRTFLFTLRNLLARLRRKRTKSVDISNAGFSKLDTEDKTDSIELHNMPKIRTISTFIRSSTFR